MVIYEQPDQCTNLTSIHGDENPQDATTGFFSRDSLRDEISALAYQMVNIPTGNVDHLMKRISLLTNLFADHMPKNPYFDMQPHQLSESLLGVVVREMELKCCPVIDIVCNTKPENYRLDIERGFIEKTPIYPRLRARGRDTFDELEFKEERKSFVDEKLSMLDMCFQARNKLVRGIEIYSERFNSKCRLKIQNNKLLEFDES
jgi:hypothetical protein